MKRTNLLILTILAWTMSSCLIGYTPHEYTYTSYVYKYTCPDTMCLRQDRNAQNSIAVCFNGKSIKRENSKLYDVIGKKHNDMTYNKIEHRNDPAFPHYYLAVDFVSINVISDRDFDETHPAGTSLNDLVRFTAYSPYNYIQRGYQGEPEQEWINKLLSECTANDFLMTTYDNDGYSYYEIDVENGYKSLFGACSLQFVQVPTLALQHNITVNILDDAHKTHRAVIDMDWTEQ